MKKLWDKTHSTIERQTTFKREYDEKLKDKETILFYIENNVYISTYTNNGIEDEDYQYRDGIEYVNEIGIEHLAKKENILDADKIVYPCKSITIIFKAPIMDNVTFNINARDKDKGFSNSELSEVCLKYFRLIQHLHFHYDLDYGTYVEKKDKEDDLFNCCLGDDGFDVKITGLEYEKEFDRWEVLLNDYV